MITITGQLHESYQDEHVTLRWKVREDDGRVTVVNVPMRLIALWCSQRVGTNVQIIGNEIEIPGGGVELTAVSITIP